jgi:hypothetical protein
MVTGLALFVTRVDGAEIDKKEQASLVKLVAKHAKALKITSAEGKRAAPRFYDYGNYEKKGVGVALYSDFILSQMPDDIREDHEEVGKRDALKIGKLIAKDQPRVYAFKAYCVEV